MPTYRLRRRKPRERLLPEIAASQRVRWARDRLVTRERLARIAPDAGVTNTGVFITPSDSRPTLTDDELDRLRAEQLLEAPLREPEVP